MIASSFGIRQIVKWRQRNKMLNNQQHSSILPIGNIANQMELNLYPVKELEEDGFIQMGVLSDGTPYLTLRGLARLCGVDHTALLRLANGWNEEQLKPRGVKIKELLAAQGYKGENLHIRTRGRGGENHAYTDAVCMAILEYYAFEATQGSSDIAIRSYRLLARKSLREVIYNRCGFNPNQHIPDSWRNFHERILLNDEIPKGYFSIFREIADIVVHIVQSGCPHNDHSVPDISVGQTWGTYWSKNKLDEKYGNRVQFPHNYPEWYRQSAVNPVPAWIYPISALGVFRDWLYEHYIPEKFPAYLERKVKDGSVLPSRAEQLVKAVTKKELTSKTVGNKQLL